MHVKYIVYRFLGFNCHVIFGSENFSCNAIYFLNISKKHDPGFHFFKGNIYDKICLIMISLL